MKDWDSQIAIDLDDIQTKEVYIHQREEQKEMLAQNLRKIGIESIFLDEWVDMSSEFLKLMKRREYSL